MGRAPIAAIEWRECNVRQFKVDAETIAERRMRLMALQRKISRENLRAFKGRTETALVEGPSKDNPLVWEARLESMAPDIDGKLYLTDIETGQWRTGGSGRRGQGQDYEDRCVRFDRPCGGNSPAARDSADACDRCGATGGKTHAHFHGRGAARAWDRIVFYYPLCSLCSPSALW